MMTLVITLFVVGAIGWLAYAVIGMVDVRRQREQEQKRKSWTKAARVLGEITRDGFGPPPANRSRSSQ
jgi:hypothetical protein